MSYHVRYTKQAREDIKRLYSFLVTRDRHAAIRAKDAIANAMQFLKEFPFSCRKASSDNSFLREMLVSFGQSGYVMLFEIEDSKTVTILAIRHQREEDYY